MKHELFFTAIAYKNDAGVVAAECGFLTAQNIIEAEGMANRQFREQFTTRQVLHIQCMPAQAGFAAAQKAQEEAAKVKKPTERNLRRIAKKEAAKPAAKKAKA